MLESLPGRLSEISSRAYFYILKSICDGTKKSLLWGGLFPFMAGAPLSAGHELCHEAAVTLFCYPKIICDH